MTATTMGSGFFEQPTFDTVVFGEGPTARWFSFREFRELPLRERVQLTLSQPARFFLGGAQISRADAMRYQGYA